MAEPAYESDDDLAAAIATRAGALLVELRQSLQESGADEKAIRAEGDRASHDAIMDELALHRPSDAVLSEEGADDQARLAAPRVWIVDPLDGTREFSEGRADWAVHVALVEGGAVTAAAVALPGLGRTLTMRPASPLAPPHDGSPRLVVSRTRPPAIAEQVSAAIDGELIPLGSAGAKTMAIVLGDADVYVHGGGQYEWDSAAPVGVALAAGLHASRLDGSPLVYNRENPWLPDLIVCRPELAPVVLPLVRDAG
jgi:3'(2'), 5'-bisphosphate nucleotidase